MDLLPFEEDLEPVELVDYEEEALESLPATKEEDIERSAAE